MWIGGKNPDALRHFLNGLYLGIGIFGGSGGFDEFYWQAAIARGWEFSSAPAEYWMKKRGMTDEAIIDEMLNIEIDAYILRTKDRSELGFMNNGSV